MLHRDKLVYLKRALFTASNLPQNGCCHRSGGVPLIGIKFDSNTLQIKASSSTSAWLITTGKRNGAQTINLLNCKTRNQRTTCLVKSNFVVIFMFFSRKKMIRYLSVTSLNQKFFFKNEETNKTDFLKFLNKRFMWTYG